MGINQRMDCLCCSELTWTSNGRYIFYCRPVWYLYLKNTNQILKIVNDKSAIFKQFSRYLVLKHSVGWATHYFFSVIPQSNCKHIEKHKAHTIAPLPNPKQWQIGDPFDLMMIIRSSKGILTIIRREMDTLNTHSPMKGNWQNRPNLRRTLQTEYIWLAF